MLRFDFQLCIPVHFLALLQAIELISLHFGVALCEILSHLILYLLRELDVRD